MSTVVAIVVLAVLGILTLAGWLVRGWQRRRRWELAESLPVETTGEGPRPGPALERPTLARLDLSTAMDRAVAWADAAEAQGRGFWRDARGSAGPDEYLELFAQVQDLLPEVFDEDMMGLTPSEPPEITLRVASQPWVVALQRRDGFLDDAFWTFLNRVLEARGRGERLAAPRLANWRIPVVVSSRDELRSLRERGLGFLGSLPPLYPRPDGDALRFSQQPNPEPAAFRRELGVALGVGGSSAQVALERVGKLLTIHLRKYRMLQLGSFGSFQLRVGPKGAVHLRFRAARPLRERVANPVMRSPLSPVPRLPAIDPTTLQAVVTTMVQHLSLGSGAVIVPGFGLFWRELVPAAIMRHPQNQQPIMIPARRDVVFEPEPGLLSAPSPR